MTKTCTCGATFETDKEDRVLCDACLAAQAPVEGIPATETPAAGDGEPTA